MRGRIDKQRLRKYPSPEGLRRLRRLRRPRSSELSLIVRSFLSDYG